MDGMNTGTVATDLLSGEANARDYRKEANVGGDIKIVADHSCRFRGRKIKVV